jgi:hypothetical protein
LNQEFCARMRCDLNFPGKMDFRALVCFRLFKFVACALLGSCISTAGCSYAVMWVEAAWLPYCE